MLFAHAGYVHRHELVKVCTERLFHLLPRLCQVTCLAQFRCMVQYLSQIAWLLFSYHSHQHHDACIGNVLGMQCSMKDSLFPKYAEHFAHGQLRLCQSACFEAPLHSSSLHLIDWSDFLLITAEPKKCQATVKLRFESFLIKSLWNSLRCPYKLRHAPHTEACSH